MVSCDPAPPPQCSWFSGRERKQVEGVREGQQEEEAVRSGAFTAAMTMVDSEDGAAGGGGGGGQDLSCQAGEQRRHPGGRLNQLWAVRH